MYRKLENIKEQIINAIIEIGAKEGADNVTARKIAAKIGISTFTVFDNFKTKQNYLDQAILTIDEPRMDIVVKMVNEGKDLNEVWDYMFEDFIKHDQDALFYNSYVNYFGFDVTQDNPRAERFLFVARKLFNKEDKNDLSDEEILLKWDFVTTMVLYYSEKVIKEFLPNTDEVKAA